MPAHQRPAMSTTLTAALGLAVHLGLGVLILASGVVAPPWAVGSLLFVWAVLLVAAMRGWRKRLWAVVLLPLAMFLCWLLVLYLGAELLGWSA